MEEDIDSVEIYKLGDKHVISDKEFYASIGSLYIQMQKKTIEKGVISSLTFKIEDPIILYPNLWVHNFFAVKPYESIDESEKKFQSIAELGFKEMPKAQFIEIMQAQPFTSTKYMVNHRWFIYEGDLNLAPEDVERFSGYSF